MKPVRIEPEAYQDISDGFAWYESQRPGLGSRFLDQLDVVQQRITDQPTAFPVYHRQARRALVRRFPDLVLFVEFADGISIVGVFHTARDPAAIRRRATR